MMEWSDASPDPCGCWMLLCKGLMLSTACLQGSVKAQSFLGSRGMFPRAKKRYVQELWPGGAGLGAELKQFVVEV